MKRLNIEQYRAEFEELFGKQLTTRQLWLLVKMCKNVRLRCRNNTAFNNFMNQLFPYALFRQVTKEVPDFRNPGQKRWIEGLQITVGTTTSDDTEDEGAEE